MRRIDPIVTRRLFVQGAGVGLAALAADAAPAAILRGERDTRPALFLIERGVAGGEALHAAMANAGVPIVAFAGDVGEPWMNAVQPLWRRRPAAVAGVTGTGALFCLEQLGKSAGLACTFRSGGAWLLQPVTRT